MVAENLTSRNSIEFLNLEQFVLASYPDTNIEICCNDVQDFQLFLHRLMRDDDLEMREEDAGLVLQVVPHVATGQHHARGSTASQDGNGPGGGVLAGQQ